MQGLRFLTGGSFRSRLETLLTLLIVVLGIGLSGCSSPPPEKEVGRRVLERWHALIQRDMDKAYGYLSPGYRAVNSLALYSARIGKAIQWKDATLKNVSCADKTCEVTINIRYQYVAPSVGDYEGERSIKEKWMQVDDEWWLLPKD